MENNLYRNLDAFEAYIGTPEKFEWYKKVFESYNVNGIEKFSWNWSWWSFFFAPTHLIYRKCYIEALIIWLIQVFLIPTGFISLVFYIGTAVVSPLLIYRRYKRTLDKVEYSIDDKATKIDTIRKLGGVDVVARNIAIFLQFFVIFIFICNFLVMIGINLFFFNFMTPFIFL